MSSNSKTLSRLLIEEEFKKRKLPCLSDSKERNSRIIKQDRSFITPTLPKHINPMLYKPKK